MMHRIGRAGNFAVCVVALVLSACTSFGSNNDDGPADSGLDTIVDHGGNPDDVTPIDAPHDSIDDQAGDVRPDTNVPDVETDGIVPVDVTDSVDPDADVVGPDLVGPDSLVDNTPVDLPPETDACIPDCDGRICGNDGCGDVCGYCGYGFACNQDDGQCIEICIPDCLTEGKVCGDDGCMGSCGECGVNFKCGPDFKCYPDLCESNCLADGLECGLDKCGNSCGTCGATEVCTVNGKCGPGACFGVDLERNTCSLDGQYLYICLDSTGTQSLLKMDCYAATGAECGTRGCDCHYNAWSGKNECIEKPPCVPDCFMPGTENPKECGDDGCGGTCDTCEGGWRCTSEFKCRPTVGAECVWVDWVGTCWSDNWLYTCSSDMNGQGEILGEDCTASGKTCYYNVSAQHYICGTI